MESGGEGRAAPPDEPGGLIVAGKLVALDIVLHGPRFILAKVEIGTPAILALVIVQELRKTKPLK